MGSGVSVIPEKADLEEFKSLAGGRFRQDIFDAYQVKGFISKEKIMLLDESVGLSRGNSHCFLMPEKKFGFGLEAINSWEFDALALKNDELSEAMTIIFSACGFLDEFKIPPSAFSEFLNEISSRYLENPYHNYKHGCDVCQTVYRIITVPNLNAVFPRLDFFSMLVAAIAHDVGHVGVNNAFLVKARHELAIKYNDQSPLENMHCGILFEVVGKEKSNIFVNLSGAQLESCRKVILGAILGTDMMHHFGQVAKAQAFLDANGDVTRQFDAGTVQTIGPLLEEGPKMFMLELLLHFADISNPYKPFSICAGWAELVCEEFALQGDREKREGMEVTPMMNRDLIVLCNTQLGFIDFVVAPMLSVVVKIFPRLHEIGANITTNYSMWGGRRKAEVTADEKMTAEAKTEECNKLDERIAKFQEKMEFVKELKSLVESYAPATVQVAESAPAPAAAPAAEPTK